MPIFQKIFYLIFYLILSFPGYSQDTEQQTYCNPVNLDYTYMIYNAHNGLSYRSGADPAIVEFRNEYYLFVTRSMGYWHSKDILDWTFVKPEQWFFKGSNAPHNPFSYKPGGYMNGAGHGSTVLGPQNTYWHFTTGVVGVNIGWERRIVMYPTYFDSDGLLYSETSYGDYPHYGPTIPGKAGEFTGWMLLSYDKPVTASTSDPDHAAGNITDENVKTFWLAAKNDDSQWIQIDLEKPADIFAIQVNYNDYKSDMYGKIPGLHHRYTIEGSLDGEEWYTLIDRSDNYEDVPNDYVELGESTEARYIRYNNIHVPTPSLSLSALRVFGKGKGTKPAGVRKFKAERGKDRREAHLSWSSVENAQGYNIRWGIAPDKLYSSWMVYGDMKLELRSLNTDQEYFYSIEAFNENGMREMVNDEW